MTKHQFKSFCGAVLLSSFVGTTYAGIDEDNFTTPFGGATKMNLLLPSLPQNSEDTTSDFNLLDKYSKKGSVLSSDNLKVSGVMRFLTLYRSMDESYLDMINSSKNFSFTDYPLANVGTNSNGGFPMLELNLQSKLTSNFDFNVGYSMAQSFSGNTVGSKNLSIRQNLNFRGTLRTGMVKSTVYAGEILWTNLSRFTMGQPEYRDNYFDRLPWDWYRKSFVRYQEYYSLSNNIGGEALGSSPLQGFIGEFEWLPLQLNFKAIYGRTNRSLALSKSTDNFPSVTQGYRVEKIIFERKIRGKVGFNFYQKNAKTDFIGDSSDINSIGTIDFALKVINKVNVSGEFGFGKIQNPYFLNNPGDNGIGSGGSLKLDFDNRSVLWPFSVEYYYIQNNLVSLDGSIINSNGAVRDGGYLTEKIYDNMYFANASTEVGQIANNRQGVNLKLEATISDFKVQFGYALGQEIEQVSDTIVMQHRVNSFSRSRFRPWFQAGGPYGRIKSFWLRTFETLTIGNALNPLTERDNLGFNTIELFLKYKIKMGKKHELVLLNFSSINSVKEGFNAFSIPDDKTYFTLYYNDFTAAFKLTEKLSLVGNFAIEHVKGSERINLSPDKAVEYDLTGKVTNYDDLVINQIGHAYAIGIDYDVTNTTSLHWRNKYMDHKDKNFLNDKFSGFESTLELKIFF